MFRLSDLRRELRPTLTLAFPIIIGQVSQMLIGLTDNFFIGRVGRVPLAAAAFTHGVFGIFYVVGIGLLLGRGSMRRATMGRAKRPAAPPGCGMGGRSRWWSAWRLLG